jgi:hypothetical protein
VTGLKPLGRGDGVAAEPALLIPHSGFHSALECMPSSMALPSLLVDLPL